MTSVDNPNVQHEETDVNIRAIFGFAGGLLVATILISFFVWLLFGFFASREEVTSAPQYPLAAGQEDRLPPEPRLQTSPRQDLKELRAQEEQALNGYRWVDRGTGVVRIPIDEAMRLTLERGLPSRPTGQERVK